jgi:hypothetical protein
VTATARAVLVAGACVLAACTTSEGSGARAGVETACAAAAPSLALMDRLLERFNARDVAGWNATFHFPNMIVANGAIRTVASPGDQAETIPNLLRQGWVRSEWRDLRVLQCAEAQAHLGATFLRFRADGTLLSETEALYVIERRDGRWGVTVRSLLPG